MHVDTNVDKLKVDQKSLRWEWAEMGVASLVPGLKKNELMKGTDFLHSGVNSGKQNVISMIFGWAWSKIAWSFSL